MEIELFGLTIKLKKGAIAAIFTLLVLATGVIGVQIKKSSLPVIIDKTSRITEGSTPEANPSPASTTNANQPERESIFVYVTGCVKNPGVVDLYRGQLILDAINAAGGATEEADLDSINLVYKINENVMLKIKSAVEAKATAGNSSAGKGAELIGDSGGAILYETETEKGKTGGLININKASDKELDTLPGIGISTAKDIVSYRQKNGPFKALSDIMKVPGIKESRFDKIKDYITID